MLKIPATAAVVAELVNDDIADLSATTHVVRQWFRSAEEFADLFIT